MTQEAETDDQLRELYQEMILDHSRHPRNFRSPDNRNREALGHNPLCGDKIIVYLDVDPAASLVRDAAFQGSGCAISTASASIMTEMVRGKSIAEAKGLFERFRAMCTGCAVEKDSPFACDGCDDRLAALAGVRHYPMRVKCATLAWHALASALDNGDNEKEAAADCATCSR